MPVQTVSFDIGALAVAGQMAAVEERDGLARACNLLAAQKEVKGTPKWEGGQNFPVTINMQDHTSITQFVDGFELFDPSANETQRNALYPICISGLLMKIGVAEQILYGQTTGSLKKKIRLLTSSCMGFLQRAWETRILTGTGAGFANWITLNGIDSTLGVFEEQAVGLQTNTIGGLPKSTYNTVIGWQNVLGDFANAFGTNQIVMYQMLEQTKIHKAVNTRTKRWFMTVNGMTFLKRVTQGYERFTTRKSSDLDLGVEVDVYQGIRIYQENFLPIAGATTATHPMTALLLDLEDIYWAWGKPSGEMGNKLPDGYFGTGEWGSLGGLQNMVLGSPMMVYGNTIVTDMGSSGIGVRGQVF